MDHAEWMMTLDTSCCMAFITSVLLERAPAIFTCGANYFPLIIIILRGYCQPAMTNVWSKDDLCKLSFHLQLDRIEVCLGCVDLVHRFPWIHHLSERVGWFDFVLNSLNTKLTVVFFPSLYLPLTVFSFNPSSFSSHSMLIPPSTLCL